MMGIEQYILFVITLLLGYSLGHNEKPGEQVKEQLGKLKYQGEQIVKEIKYKNIKPGVVERPNASRLHELNNPQVQEETEAMRETLKQGIEPLTPLQ